MKKLKVIEHGSLDGVMQQSAADDASPHEAWTAPYRTPAGRDMPMAAHGERFDLLLGRRTDDLRSDSSPTAPSSPIGDRLDGATKYVATHRRDTLDRRSRTRRRGTHPSHRVGRDRDLMRSGSSMPTSPVIEDDLADEVVLIVNPVLLGTGERLFGEGTPARASTLVASQTMPTGVLLDVYRYDGTLKTA